MRTEISLFTAFLLALILKFSHVPGANILLLLSLNFTALLYCPFAFYFFCDKKLKNQNLALSIFSGIFLAIIPIGILFTLLFWPGAMVNLSAGLLSGIVILAAIFLLRKKAGEQLHTYYKNMALRTSVWLSLCILFLALPLQTRVYLNYGYDPELARLKYQYYSNPDNQQYAEELKAYEQEQLQKDIDASMKGD